MEFFIILVVVIVLAAVAVGAVLVWRRQRSARLQEQFGSEYDRTVADTGGAASAEKKLADRERRRDRLDIVALSAESATRYRDEWNQIQLRFVDEPERAVQEADVLVVRVMRECGYPIDDFDQRAKDLSVDHPEVVQHYRDAHGVAVAQTRGSADTEQMRRAVTSYRALVDALLADHDHTTEQEPPPTDSQNLQEER